METVCCLVLFYHFFDLRLDLSSHCWIVQFIGAGLIFWFESRRDDSMRYLIGFVQSARSACNSYTVAFFHRIYWWISVDDWLSWCRVYNPVWDNLRIEDTLINALLLMTGWCWCTVFGLVVSRLLLEDTMLMCGWVLTVYAFAWSRFLTNAYRWLDLSMLTTSWVHALNSSRWVGWCWCRMVSLVELMEVYTLVRNLCVEDNALLSMTGWCCCKVFGLVLSRLLTEDTIYWCWWLVELM